MKTLHFVFVILLFIILSACAPASTDAEQAEQALIAFFDHLNKGEYAEADALYDGTYEIMIDHNPSVDPSDHVTLWRHACAINGAQCLTVRTAAFKERNGEAFIFTVEFNNPDGSLFVQGPCCGGNETDMPSRSQFEYHVLKTAGGQFKVMGMPVYTH